MIVYFTHSETDGVDTVSGASRVSTNEGVVGNVENIANTIAKETNYELFKIDTVEEYPGTH